MVMMITHGPMAVPPERVRPCVNASIGGGLEGTRAEARPRGGRDED